MELTDVIEFAGEFSISSPGGFSILGLRTDFLLTLRAPLENKNTLSKREIKKNIFCVLIKSRLTKIEATEGSTFVSSKIKLFYDSNAQIEVLVTM